MCVPILPETTAHFVTAARTFFSGNTDGAAFPCAQPWFRRRSTCRGAVTGRAKRCGAALLGRWLRLGQVGRMASTQRKAS